MTRAPSRHHALGPRCSHDERGGREVWRFEESFELAGPLPNGKCPTQALGARFHYTESGKLPGLFGDVSIRRGQIEQARHQLQSAKELYQRHAEIVGEANVELSLAHLSDRMGDLETAAVHFGVAAERYERAGRAKGQAQALCGLALVEALRGGQELAEAHSDPERARAP